MFKSLQQLAGFIAALAFAGSALAGAQLYEPMSDSVRTALAKAVEGDRDPPEPLFASSEERVAWLTHMAERLPRKWKTDSQQRIEFLKTVRYEAQRAGLDPELVLGLIEVESYFRRYAISSAGARGYMQVMPFWTKIIGNNDSASLFDMRTNIRMGCVILRHYLDKEKGDLFLALGRYNGSRGKDPYPRAVLRAWEKWKFPADWKARQAPAPRQ
jgi:soluble lytic murein transglycosylase-like protein